MPFDIKDILTAPSATREIVTQVYVYIIESITGEPPNIARERTRTFISWRPGQARKLQDFIMAQFKEKALTTEEIQTGPPSLLPFSEVIIDTRPVLMPLVVKAAVAPTALGVLAGALLFGKKPGRKKP